MKICVPNGFGASDEVDVEYIAESDDELLDTNSPSGSVLSADAEPFHPSGVINNDGNPQGDVDINIENGIAIYNDGIPCLALIDEKDRRSILNGISDEALLDDSCFPLDAIDAAELEAMEAFVVEMANLAMLEEREEQARASFAHVQKRWEVRRQKGPSQRGPRPCMNLIVPTSHTVNTAKTLPTKSNNMSTIIAYSHALRIQEERMRAKEILATSPSSTGRKCNESRYSLKNSGKQLRHQIHQPRKDS